MECLHGSYFMLGGAQLHIRELLLFFLFGSWSNFWKFAVAAEEFLTGNKESAKLKCRCFPTLRVPNSCCTFNLFKQPPICVGHRPFFFSPTRRELRSSSWQQLEAERNISLRYLKLICTITDLLFFSSKRLFPNFLQLSPFGSSHVRSGNTCTLLRRAALTSIIRFYLTIPK